MRDNEQARIPWWNPGLILESGIGNRELGIGGRRPGDPTRAGSGRYFERSLSTSNCWVPSRMKLTSTRPLALATSVWNSLGLRTGS